MSITGIESTAANSQAAQSRATLADNFDTFLTLLTAQLQNQDPLEPMDTAEFTNQLVQYSEVEQSIQVNDNLEDLVALTQVNSAGQIVSYLGRTVEAFSSDAPLSNGSAEWAYTIGETADNVTLTVRDSAGRIVYETDGETSFGNHVFTWDGTNNGGEIEQDGVYTLSIEATGADGEPIATDIRMRGIINAVDFLNGDASFSVGGVEIGSGQIVRLETTPSEAL